MKKTIKRFALLLIVALAIGLVPSFGGAAEDTGNCVTSATAAPAPGGTQQSLAPVDPSGTVYAQQAGSAPAGRIGARGAHGWIQLSGDGATQTGRLEGRNSDTGLSGYIIIAGANSKICVSHSATGKIKPLG